MTLVMSLWTSGPGLWNCCAPCHSVLNEELCSKGGHGDRPVGPIPFFGKGGEPLVPASIIPAALVSARGGNERSDWTPRAAAFGYGLRPSPRGGPPQPPQELLVNVGGPMAASTSASGGGNGGVQQQSPCDGTQLDKAAERSRLRRLVGEFVQKASSSAQRCSVIPLGDAVGGSLGTRQPACYELVDEVERFVLRGKGDDEQWEVIASCPLRAMQGAHKAEDSALVRRCRNELLEQVSPEELVASAVLEFGAGTCKGSAPLLIIEESVHSCERLVAAVQILRLYKGAAQRLESARSTGSSSSSSSRPCPARLLQGSPGPTAPRPSAPASSQTPPSGDRATAGSIQGVAQEGARVGRPVTTRGTAFRPPARLGVVADDDPAVDGVGASPSWDP